ncbi:hypothetical protein [Caulobacter sp. 1776]|uniref:hypothetical protein n=1 Tax=Caulobacter sp. 1776 TaxID=3156420 RepID=UPI00339A0026
MAKLNPEAFVLLQAAPPPAAVPTPPALQRLAPISQKARPLLLTKGGRTENAVVRYQVFLRTIVKPGPTPATPEGVTVSAIPCAWTVESYLQRDLCFYSITGLLGCEEGATKPLTAVENGQVDLPAGTTCEVFAKPVTAAEDRVIAALDRLKDQMFDEDYQLAVKPRLVRGGATITER